MLLLALLAIATILFVMCGVSVFLVYKSSPGIVEKAHEAMSRASSLERGMIAGDADELRAAVSGMSADVEAIYEETHTPAWAIARFVPVVGHDVANVQDVASCALDLTQNALTPLSDQIAGISFDDFVQDRSVNTTLLAAVLDTVVSISPAASSSIDKLAELTPGSIDRVNDLVEKLKAPLTNARRLFDNAEQMRTILLGMLGDDGQTRTYVILPENNAEIRAGGGFPGVFGILHITDGVATLEQFSSTTDTQHIVFENGYEASISESEITAFEEALGIDAAACTLTPDFVRTGQLVKQFWENAYGITVDGVIALDPVFLQRLLDMIGGVTVPDGTLVDGTNAAYELMSNVYWRYGYEEDCNQLMDQFFDDVAHAVFSRLFDAMSEFDAESFSQLWNVIVSASEDHRFSLWMADEDSEGLIQELGLSGELRQDPAHPELCIFANDNTWAKLCWYLESWAELGDGTRNSDGSTTYRVVAHFQNTITEEQAAIAPGYVRGGNPFKRNDGDLMETVVIMAPVGATITDYQVHQDTPIPSDKIIPGKPYNAQCVLYGCDTRVSHINIGAGGDTTVTFALNMPSGSEAKPEIRTSPLCHD